MVRAVFADVDSLGAAIYTTTPTITIRLQKISINDFGIRRSVINHSDIGKY